MDWMYSQTSSAAPAGIAAKLGACSTGTTCTWSGTKPPLSMDTKDSRATDATRCVSFSLERQNQHPVGGAAGARFFRRSSLSACLCSSLFAIATVMSRPKNALSVSSNAFAAASAVSNETWQNPRLRPRSSRPSRRSTRAPHWPKNSPIAPSSARKFKLRTYTVLSTSPRRGRRSTEAAAFKRFAFGSSHRSAEWLNSTPSSAPGNGLLPGSIPEAEGAPAPIPRGGGGGIGSAYGLVVVSAGCCTSAEGGMVSAGASASAWSHLVFSLLPTSPSPTKRVT